MLEYVAEYKRFFSNRIDVKIAWPTLTILNSFIIVNLGVLSVLRILYPYT